MAKAKRPGATAISERPVVSASSKAAMASWQRAYEEYPAFASTFAWKHVVEVLNKYPGERVYEIGFGSGANLAWARRHGWEVAGCEVADAAMRIASRELSGADLRKESIVDCSAPSGYYDVVIDRAACSCLTQKDMKRALSQVRRILKPEGVFLFNPYGPEQTRPFPECLPPQTFWSPQDMRRLFPATKWEVLSDQSIIIEYVGDRPGEREHTLRTVVRKIASS